MPSQTPHDFIHALQVFRALPAVFNPWRDIDPLHDLGKHSPVVRSQHLLQYLSERLGHARIVLCAEALGYQGGHFSGIPMTSERMLLGNLARTKNIPANDVIAGGGQRTSRITAKTPELGANEPTATVVWGALKAAGIDTRKVVLWNAFAPHPMQRANGWLTNRKPTARELELGLPLLQQFLAMFPSAQTIAIGKVSQEVLAGLGVAVAGQVRHPAYGGAAAFRTQVVKLLA